jgi:hypothetical protein
MLEAVKSTQRVIRGERPRYGCLFGLGNTPIFGQTYIRAIKGGDGGFLVQLARPFGEDTSLHGRRVGCCLKGSVDMRDEIFSHR